MNRPQARIEDALPRAAGGAYPFLWGAATSSHQVEGGNTANDWWAWEKQGRLKEASGAACDQFRRFPEDLAILKGLGHSAHRFSLEWSRFEPEEGRWDDAAFAHYEGMLKALRAEGIEPVVTLHHFTIPQWLAERGGWLSEASIRYFVRYAGRAVKAYSPYVRFWITVNEPLIFLYFGYYAGIWPPGLKSFPDTLRVFRHLMRAHQESYRVIHRHYAAEGRPVWVSIAQHMTSFTPCRPHSLADRWAVFLRGWFVNTLFFDAAITGFLYFPGMFSEFLPSRGTLDFLGVNYYTRDFIRFTKAFGAESLGVVCDKGHHGGEVREMSAMGWEVYAEGLEAVLRRLKRYHLPILVTENGVATSEDAQRERFIRTHLAAVDRARRAGVPVFGYLYWSLLDNFEWAHGYEPRFGIVGVDYATQERKIRPSAQVLSETCRQLERQIGGRF